MTIQIIRAAVLHFPRQSQTPAADIQYFAAGGLVIDDGKIVDLNDYGLMVGRYPDADVVDYRGKLLIPGLIDSHIHFPQTEMIASYGEQLLEWLENYTFPVERKFADPVYAQKIADVFLQQLLRNGTTTAMVYSSVHKEATDALFSAAQQRQMLIIGGKTCMDRHCPEWLQDSAQTAQRQSAELIEQWHGKDRLYYCLTPRFAPTSSPAQLECLGELAQQYPDVFIQTHLSESRQEIEWVKSLYPDADNYLDVYDRAGLVRSRAVFGHCIHLVDDEWSRLSESGATIAFCPSSNLFLGSGLFALHKAREHQVHVTLGTDVGAGTSFNLLRTMGDAYKVCQLQGDKLDPLTGLYMLTQGAAVALQLEDKIGNLNIGTDADFVLLAPDFDTLSTLRLRDSSKTDNPADIIFALSMLGDDRAIAATWVNGCLAYQQQEEQLYAMD
ncbi:guanine deaminase [Neptunicella sp. SCSIO 80796]|uniref:guanine deaminase n=1 Tax=Neptunicella plasticusilytica TaxID=3117012 RepID=UPI003A4E2787